MEIAVLAKVEHIPNVGKSAFTDKTGTTFTALMQNRKKTRMTMSDLIDRKKALDEISKIDTSIIPSGWVKGYVDETIKETQRIIRTIPSAEPEMKWIPVTEAMPINDVDVIVSVLDDSGDTPYRFTSVGWCTPNGQYWVVDNEMCYGVIAWMPLPEPWRGDR